MSALFSLEPAAPVPPREWLAYSLVPVGELVLLDGPSGAGKSLLAAYLAAGLSHTRHAKSPASVLVLSSPDQKELFAEHLAFQKPEYKHIRAIQYEPDPDAPIPSVHLLSFIESNIVEHQPKLFIIDSLEELLQQDANVDLRALADFWHSLRELAQKHRCTILVPRRNGMHENRQYGPFTRYGSDTARFALTLLLHPINPAIRVITVAKDLRGPIGEQIHLHIMESRLAVMACTDPHQHVRPARAVSTWQPRPLHDHEDHEIITLVEKFMHGEPKPQSEIRNYILKGYSANAYARAMAKSKCQEMLINGQMYCFPTQQMLYRFEHLPQDQPDQPFQETPSEPVSKEAEPDTIKPLENQARAAASPQKPEAPTTTRKAS